MKRMRERLCSMILCVVMVAGLIPQNVIAVETAAPADQIGDHYQADQQTGALASAPELSGDTSKEYADGWLRTNKTISPGENENEFLITLDVRTKATIENVALSEDAAAVIAIDLSGSMNDDNKLSSAKEAALAFINDFAQTEDAEAIRKIAVVGFSGQQAQGGVWGGGQRGITAATTYQPWTDADNDSIRSAINRMNAEGGTCLQAGLILASNLLSSDEVAGISNKNIIVLTDGKPTYYLSEQAAQDRSTESIGEPGSIRGRGSSTDHNTHTSTENTAKSILANGINAYSVYLGQDRVSCDTRSCQLKNKTGADWLRQDCGFITYAVDEAGDLSSIFESISELIQLQAKAWIAEDPMGEMFDFAGFEKEPQDKNEYFYNAEDKKLQWNLRLSEPIQYTEDGFSVYQLTYKVKLNTLAPGYTADQYYPTNGITSVTWLIEKRTESGVSEIGNGTAYFNVPSAKGYAADIYFRKTDGNGQPLAGAEFGLYHEQTLISTAASDSTGTVLFENVPSGHSYTVIEESAPEGFIASAEKYNIEVACGNLIGTVGEDNTVINVPETKYGGLTVSKIISGTGANPEEEFAFTATLDDTGITGAYGDLEFTDGVARFTLKDGESVTASGLPAGTGYTVTENEAEGYIPSVNGERGATATGTIPADDTASAVFHNFYEGGRVDPDPEYGGLIISKTISGDGAIETDEFAFTVTLDNAEINGNYGNVDFANGVASFTLKGGESVTVSELLAGTGYTVTENDSKGYAVTVNGESKNAITGEIETDKLAEIAFNNYRAGEPTPPAAGIDITKTVQATGDIIPDWENIFGFVISRNLPGATGEAEVVTTPSITITGTGTDSAGYVFDNLEFTEDGTATFYVWEMPQEALFWNYDKTAYRVTFTKNLETGEVDRAYTRITGFGDEAGFEPVSDISFTNVYHHEDEPIIGTNGGDLTVSKTVSRGDREKAFTFTVTLDDPEVNGQYGDILFADGVAVLQLKDGESATAEELPADVGYTVRESDNSGYTVTVNGTSSAVAEGKIIEDETAVAAFQNDKIPPTGSVKVTKTVTGNRAPTGDISYSFEAWVRDSDGNAVSESVSYTHHKADGSTENGTVAIGKDGYAFGLKDGESMTFAGIAEGGRFEVREITTGDFTTTVSGLTDGFCTILPNGTKEVAFVNDYGDAPPPTSDAPSPTSGTKVTKTVTGNPSVPKTGDSSHFGLWVTLLCLSLFGLLVTIFIGKRRATR